MYSTEFGHFLSGDVFETALNPEGYGTDRDDNDFARYPNALVQDGVANECGVSLPANEADNDADGYVECTIDVNGCGNLLRYCGDDCDDDNAAGTLGERGSR